MDLGGVLMAAVDAGVGGGELGMLGSTRLLKHGRGNAEADDHGGWSRPAAAAAKQARTEAEVSEAVRAAAPYLVGTCSPGHGQEKMLSFSSSAASSCHSTTAVAEAAAMPLYYGTPASCSGLSSASLSASIQGAMARVRGPFTPSQWMELEHQALIYKYMAANIPVPHNLLIPIRRSLTSLYPPAAYFGSSTLGWGSFQLGYSGNADLEPGRCRRTDGKKWRCSRDAVSDQKYCERHMNRGKHRSRKHVEGQPGHAAKAMPVTVAAAAQPSALATGGGGATAGIAISHQQQPVNNYAANTIDPCSLQYNRELVNRQNESEQVQDSDESLSMLTSMSARNTGSLFPFSKEHNPFEMTSSRPDYALVSSDSLMSSPHSSLENVNLLAPQGLNEQQQSSVSLQHFVDWPRTPSQQGGLSWPENEDMQAQRTQLSISAPMASSDLSSASTSPIHEKLMLSPLKLSREYSPIGLSIAAVKHELVDDGEADWMPMFRDSSMGGPLGEALTKNSNMEARNYLSSSLSLMTDAWDSSPLESSPVGVLQRNAFGSVSSSTGSSPRLEQHHHGVYDGLSNLRDDLGSVVVNHHPSIRLL